MAELAEVAARDEYIYCETHKCKISVSGCMARQEQANREKRSGWGARGGQNSGHIPFDPACKDCEQGAEVISNESGKDGAERIKKKRGRPKIATELHHPEKHVAMQQDVKDQEETVSDKSEKQEIPPVKEDVPPVKEDDPQEIPYGYCHCGCGQKAPIAKQTDKPKGHIAGSPMRYILGHHNRNKKWAIRQEGDIRDDKSQVAPYGYCQCGCGQITSLSQNTNSKHGVKKGEPVYFIKGHNRKGKAVVNKKDWLSTLRQLSDGRDLELELVRRAVEGLREVDAQAVWMLAEALRQKQACDD